MDFKESLKVTLAKKIEQKENKNIHDNTNEKKNVDARKLKNSPEYNGVEK